MKMDEIELKDLYVGDRFQLPGNNTVLIVIRHENGQTVCRIPEDPNIQGGEKVDDVVLPSTTKVVPEFGYV